MRTVMPKDLAISTVRPAYAGRGVLHDIKREAFRRSEDLADSTTEQRYKKHSSQELLTKIFTAVRFVRSTDLNTRSVRRTNFTISTVRPIHNSINPTRAIDPETRPTRPINLPRPPLLSS
ncbi:hypothetical protein WH47_00909 [Habropoda laboriosa]|uniref:Uncharacterized protein n=1 Tax=Habropoda laboriosa TaxID=597456 RepID=A0A0L7RK69_9HYME|nr:hypothetical protein WH47_00909 [Habropoda laboriosa]